MPGCLACRHVHRQLLDEPPKVLQSWVDGRNLNLGFRQGACMGKQPLLQLLRPSGQTVVRHSACCEPELQLAERWCTLWLHKHAQGLAR